MSCVLGLLFDHASLIASVAVAVTTAVISYKVWKDFNQIKAPPGILHDQQSVPVEGEKHTYKSGLLRFSPKNFDERPNKSIQTLYDIFLNGIEVSRNGPCLGSRKPNDTEYKWLKYSEVFQRSREIGSALITKFNIQPNNSTKIGIYAKNCPEWFITSVACVRYSMVSVPLYDTLGADAAAYIIKKTNISVIVTDDEEKVNRLLNTASETPSLKYIILIGNEHPNLEKINERAKQHGIEIHLYDDVRALGRDVQVPDVVPKPSDTYIICFTSGTTGQPKGVVLSHANVIANVTGFNTMCVTFEPAIAQPGQVSISYLPLSHMFEQVCHWVLMYFGSSVGYYSGNIAHLIDDMAVLRPTIFPVVPRLLNKLNDSIQSTLSKSGFLARTLFNLAYKHKLALLKERVVTNNTIWDKLVFRKLQQRLGGNLRMIITGSAPISTEVLEICRVTLGAVIIEGYGQTECTAMATCTWPGDYVGGHCGGPGTCTVIRLGDVPELNYFASEGKGEILIKGPSVTEGYYQDPEKTAELFDEDGYLRTGDIGQVLPTGGFKIIDRKKHIFKLAQGEYIAPEKIENIYVQSQFVQQIYVDGNPLERFLVAIVVPDQAVVTSWYAKQTGDSTKTIEEIVKNKDTIACILKDLQAVGKSHKLNSIEQVKAIHLTLNAFSVENGLLTPTLKAKRPQLRKMYQTVIDSLYRSTA